MTLRPACLSLVAISVVAAVAACGSAGGTGAPEASPGPGRAAGPGGGGAGAGGWGGGSGSGGSGGFMPCATGVATADHKLLPVDIIWVVDNSASMKPAVDQVNAGIKDFAAAIDAKGLDYKVIMLALKG